MRFAFTPEIEHVEGTRDYFAQELRSLGTMTTPEKWGLSFFLAATLLAFTRQFYASLLPGLNPAYVFLTFAVLCFAIRHKGEPLLKWEYAQKHMAWGLFYLFAGGAALGEILSQTGTAKLVADLLVPFAGGGGFRAVLVFSLMTMVVTQITSNTAAIGIMVPDHDQHVPEPGHESDPVRLHRRGRGQLRRDAALVRRRSGGRRGLRREPEDDVLARRVARGPAVGGHRPAGICAARIGRGSGLPEGIIPFASSEPHSASFAHRS